MRHTTRMCVVNVGKSNRFYFLYLLLLKWCSLPNRIELHQISVIFFSSAHIFFSHFSTHTHIYYAILIFPSNKLFNRQTCTSYISDPMGWIPPWNTFKCILIWVYKQTHANNSDWVITFCCTPNGWCVWSLFIFLSTDFHSFRCILHVMTALLTDIWAWIYIWKSKSIK